MPNAKTETAVEDKAIDAKEESKPASGDDAVKEEKAIFQGQIVFYHMKQGVWKSAIIDCIRRKEEGKTYPNVDLVYFSASHGGHCGPARDASFGRAVGCWNIWPPS